MALSCAKSGLALAAVLFLEGFLATGLDYARRRRITGKYTEIAEVAIRSNTIRLLVP